MELNLAVAARGSDGAVGHLPSARVSYPLSDAQSVWDSGAAGRRGRRQRRASVVQRASCA